MFQRVSFLLLSAVLLFNLSCKNEKESEPLFQLLDDTGIDFTNEVQNTKDFNIFSYRNFYNGGGVAIGDINNDSLPDVFMTANMGSNKLYLNKGNMKFEDVSAKAGFNSKEEWSTGVVMVDINGDNWLDIYVCNAGYLDGVTPVSKLFINNKNLTFTEAAGEYGLTNPGGYTTHAAFFDYDLDGDLDCFIVNNSFIPVNTLNYANKRDLPAKDWPVASFLKGGGDKFLRNDNGKFKDVTLEVGVHGSLISFGLGVTVGDVNGDQYPDVFVSNDFFERDYLYINQKDGTFKDELEEWIEHSSLASMGADMADVNNDGYPDIFVTDMLPGDDYRLKTTSSFDNIDVYKLKERSGFHHQFMQNTLQLNNRHGKFMEIAHYSGVAASDWSWGGLMFDADNDGLTDIYVCNGIAHDVTDQDFIDFFANNIIQRMALTGRKEEVDSVLSKMPSKPILNKAFRNTGNLKFSDEGLNWGFDTPSFSNGAAYGDLDNDGDLDLVINNVNQKAFVYRNNTNQQTKNNYISVQLKGKGGNTYAIGSIVKLHSGNEIINRELIPTRGFQSSVDYKIVIGLGNRKVDSMVIIWPDRTTTSLNNPELNRVHYINQNGEGSTTVNPTILTLAESGLLQEVKQSFEKHTEDDYLDFYYERNLPRLLSREGPASAKGDVNGDGLEDIYIGGAFGKPGQLYLQTTQGFQKREVEIFNRFIEQDDVAAEFFDCDGDKDLDLVVGAGGNNREGVIRYLQTRLYRNDGKGNFDIDGKAFPLGTMNTGAIAVHDIDGDGDLDIFSGGRSVPVQYGVMPLSNIFLNDGKGIFSEMSASSMGTLSRAGMITSAAWIDINGDKRKELLVAGEWMYPHVYTFNNGKMEEMSTSLKDYKGWWQTFSNADLDGDGDEDLVLGNIGENFYLRPDSANPVKMWVKDFDKNNTVDMILSRTIEGKDVPVFMKREVTDQLPYLKKQNLRHHDYAKRSVQDLFPDTMLVNATVKEFNFNSTAIAIYEGNGKFTVKRLHDVVQFSSVNAILCTDVNNDGSIDLVLAGNQYGCPPQFGRLDAGFGNILLNNGKGEFKETDPSVSGLYLPGETRDIVELKSRSSKYVLFLRNNDFPKLYQVRK